MSAQRVQSSTVALVLALLFGLAGTGALLAQPQGQQPQKGSLSGTVLAENGKPLVGLALRLERTDPAGMGDGAGRRGGNRAVGPSFGATPLQGQGREKGVKTVARATTDQQGNFIMKEIDPGAAILVAGSKSQGWIYYPVVIEPGQETKLGEIKLSKGD